MNMNEKIEFCRLYLSGEKQSKYMNHQYKFLHSGKVLANESHLTIDVIRELHPFFFVLGKNEFEMVQKN